MTTVAEQKMVHWHHCWPSLAHSSNSNNGGSTDKWWRSRRWCHGGIVGCSLPSRVMATTVAMQMMERNNNGGSCAVNNASTLLAVPCLHVQPQQGQRRE
jgi:hypothetical protein